MSAGERCAECGVGGGGSVVVNIEQAIAVAW